MEQDEKLIPLKPYLVRAMIQWCEDNGLRPYLAVQVDEEADVPREYVSDGHIVLSVSSEAIDRPDFGNDCFEFFARFGEQARHLAVPVRAIVAAYPAERPELGLAFSYEPPAEKVGDSEEKGTQKGQNARKSFIQKVK